MCRNLTNLGILKTGCLSILGQHLVVFPAPQTSFRVSGGTCNPLELHLICKFCQQRPKERGSADKMAVSTGLKMVLPPGLNVL